MSGASDGQIILGVVGAVAGAVIGFYAGGNVVAGAQIGFAIGTAVGTAVDPPEGPNIHIPASDRVFTGSVYGTPITRINGVDRISGNVIWLNKSPRNLENETGGKGGGATSTKTVYFADIAVGLGEGPISGVRKIWADSKLVYDASDINTLITKSDIIGKIRFYKGTEAQEPDWLIEEIEGEGNVPAFRGLSYIILEDTNLEDFGNRIPNLQFEVFGTIVDAFPTASVLYRGGSINTGGWAGVYKRGLGHLFISGVNDVKIFHPESQLIVDEFRLDENGIGETGIGSISRWMDVDEVGRFLVYGNTIGGAGNWRSSLVSDLHLKKVVRRIGDNYIVDNEARVPGGGLWTINPKTFGDLDSLDYAMAGPGFGGFGAGQLNWKRPHPVLEFIAFQVSATYDHYHTIFIGESVYSVAANGSNAYLYQLWQYQDDLTNIWRVDHTNRGDLHSHFNNSDVRVYLMYVEEPDEIVVFRGGEAIKIALTTHIIGEAAAVDSYMVTGPVIDFGVGDIEHHSIRAGHDGGIIYVQGSGNRWAGLDVLGWQHFETIDTDDWGLHATRGFYVRSIDAIVGWDTDSWNTIYLHRWGNLTGTDRPTLDTVVSRYCLDAGLAAGDIDVTDLANVYVTGFSAQEQMATHQILGQLAFAFNFTMSETGGKIVFSRTDATVLDTIPEDDLGANSDDKLLELVVQENELPLQVSITYKSTDGDYQQATQASKRITDLVSTDQEITANFSGVLTHDEAAQITDKRLTRAWVGRRKFSADLPIHWLKAAPADVYEIVLGADVNRVRFKEIVLTPDFTIKIAGEADDPQVHTSTVSGVVPGLKTAVLDYAVETELFLLDLPLLRTRDDKLGFYVAMAPAYETGVWQGGALLESADNVAFDVVGLILSGSPWGISNDALGDFEDWGVMDETNSFTVRWRWGISQLASVTKSAAKGFENAFAIENVANGGWEIIAVANAVDNGDGSVTFSDMMRGVRSTERFISGHDIGDRVLFLLPAGMAIIDIDTAEVNATRYYKAQSITRSTAPELSSSLDISANMYRAWAPFNATGTLSGSDVDFIWSRRSRFGVGLELQGLPLYENPEAYEIDVLDGPGGTVLRTLIASSETVTYDNADQVTDGTNTDTIFYLNIYQIGVELGRGIPYAATVDIGAR